MNAKPKILLLAILAAVFLAPSYANAADEASDTRDGGVLKCMLINGGQTKSNGDTVYLRCGSSKYHLLSPLPWAEYKAKRQIRQ